MWLVCNTHSFRCRQDAALSDAGEIKMQVLDISIILGFDLSFIDDSDFLYECVCGAYRLIFL